MDLPLRLRAAGYVCLLVATAFVVGGCGRPEYSGFLEPYDKFQQISKINPNQEYVREEADWSAYRKVRISQAWPTFNLAAAIGPLTPTNWLTYPPILRNS